MSKLPRSADSTVRRL